jgi:plasmid stabilization system protein ParE
VQKFRVEITAIAQFDIQEIFHYIAADNQKAAVKLVLENEKQIDSLEKFPARCPVIPESFELGVEYRHVLYGHYRTIYRIEAARVIILRVIHGSRLLSMETFER